MRNDESRKANRSRRFAVIARALGGSDHVLRDLHTADDLLHIGGASGGWRSSFNASHGLPPVATLSATSEDYTREIGAGRRASIAHTGWV